MTIGDEIPDGYKLNEIAKELEVSPSWVSNRLDELRNEILLRAGKFLPLTDHEYATLLASIREHGQRVPILIGETGLLDGLHRCLALLELGTTEALAVFVIGEPPETERQIGVTVNTARRMLTRAQKEQLVRSELERDWARSSRHIAAICGVHHATVETIRTKVRDERHTETAEPALEQDDPDRPPPPPVPPPPLPNDERRIDSRGTLRPAQVARDTPPVETRDQPLGYAPCPHCGTPTLIVRLTHGKDTLGYRLDKPTKP